MSLEDATRDDKPTVIRLCAGGCGARLIYVLESTEQPYAPDLHCLDGNSRYRGGHLCNDCETAVEAALAQRRHQLQFRAPPESVRARVVPQPGRRRARKR
jgi:hypothetical protein